MSRIIGIRHRRKATSEGEARPTLVAIEQGGNGIAYALEDDTAELDFQMARFPIEWRNVEPGEDISGFAPRHCKWRKVKKDEDASQLLDKHLRKTVDKKGLPVTEVLVKVPVKFDGLRQGDKVAMVLGGSGDRYAAGLSRQGENIGAKVYRIPPFSLADNRSQALVDFFNEHPEFYSEARPDNKDYDHFALFLLLQDKPKLFYEVRRRDRNLIRVKEALAARQDAMKSRIACEQRILQSLVGKIFLNEAGGFPEGVIEDQYDAAKANDAILQALVAEENRRDKELAEAVSAVGLFDMINGSIHLRLQDNDWREQLKAKGIEVPDPNSEPINYFKGVGPRIAAGIIAPIGDIRRFMVLPDYSNAKTPEQRHLAKMRAVMKTAAKLKKFCGVHVLPDGRFPRKRAGEVANWSPQARQALYLLADQFNRRPDSEWGKKLLENKLRMREKHPDAVEVPASGNGKANGAKKTVKRYTNGHIHKMACWRTLSRFVEWLTREWLKIEENEAASV